LPLLCSCLMRSAYEPSAWNTLVDFDWGMAPDVKGGKRAAGRESRGDIAVVMSGGKVAIDSRGRGESASARGLVSLSSLFMGASSGEQLGSWERAGEVAGLGGAAAPTSQQGRDGGDGGSGGSRGGRGSNVGGRLG
jgi:hypothetical protein